MDCWGRQLICLYFCFVSICMHYGLWIFRYLVDTLILLLREDGEVLHHSNILVYSAWVYDFYGDYVCWGLMCQVTRSISEYQCVGISASRSTNKNNQILTFAIEINLWLAICRIIWYLSYAYFLFKGHFRGFVSGWGSHVPHFARDFRTSANDYRRRSGEVLFRKWIEN